MPVGYRLFYVATWSTVPGKSVEARAWYEKARELWNRLPGVRSIDAFVPQFSLGPSAGDIEIWMEIDDYEVLDRWDAAASDLGDEFIALSKVAAECVHQGPARLVGDWAGSTIEDLKGAT
jgi:hypothetical protein